MEFFSTIDVPEIRQIHDAHIAKNSNLIYALCDSALEYDAKNDLGPQFVFVLNRDLKIKNGRGGIVFILKLNLNQPSISRPFKIFLPQNLPSKVQIPIRIGSKIGIKGEAFCFEKNLMPSGYLVNVAQNGV